MASPVRIEPSIPGVLRREEFEAEKSAEQILVLARAKAQEILSRAREQAEEEKSRGFIEGKADGESKAATQIVEVVGRSVEYLSSIEEALIDVVMDALRKIIGEFDRRQLVAKIVDKAMGNLRSQQKVTLRVHPDDSKHLGADLDAMIGDETMPARFIDIVPDARLRRGSVILESEAGTIKADIHHQLRAIEKALRHSMHRQKK